MPVPINDIVGGWIRAFEAGKQSRMEQDRYIEEKKRYEENKKREDAAIKEKIRQFDERMKFDREQQSNALKVQDIINKMRMSEARRGIIGDWAKYGTAPNMDGPNLGNRIEVPIGPNYDPQYSANAAGMLSSPTKPLSEYTDPTTGLTFSREEVEGARNYVDPQETSLIRQQLSVEAMAAREAERNAANEAKWKAQLEAYQTRSDNIFAAAMARMSHSQEGQIKVRDKFMKINQIAPRLMMSQDYKSYRERNEALAYAKSAVTAGNNPNAFYTDEAGRNWTFKQNPALWDLGLIYAFARGQDPNRVSDQELQLALKSALPELERLGVKFKGIFTRTPMLTPADRMNIAKIIEARKNAAGSAMYPQVQMYKRLLEKSGVDDAEFKELLGDDIYNIYTTGQGKKSPSLTPGKWVD